MIPARDAITKSAMDWTDVVFVVRILRLIERRMKDFLPQTGNG